MPSELNGAALAEISARVHSRWKVEGKKSHVPLDVLWTRKAVRQSPLATHVSRVKDELLKTGSQDETTYDSAFRMLIDEARDLPSDSYSRDLVEMTENAVQLLQDIIEARSDTGTPTRDRGSSRVVARQVSVGNDAVAKILGRARAGANGGRCTKSKVVACPSPAYAQVMKEFGLEGVAAYPVFLGCWWMALLLCDFDDWRQDYLAILDYSFFFEYNVDRVGRGRSSSALLGEILAMWDMPDLSTELRLRRAHMLLSMTFFDLKRTHESEFRGRETDGLTAWVHSDRDAWRDFKALDSGGFAHWLSFASGVEGRDDMMLSGLVNDWVDLGPDLRYQECNQSVLALTRGSLALDDLLRCYERTVWMLNASFVSGRRHVGCLTIIAACIWELCNHRQDVWRYFSLGFDLCPAVESLDLYKVAELADCYTTDLLPREVVGDGDVLRVRRRRHPYRVYVQGVEHSGSVQLDTEVCDAVEGGLLPASMVEYQIILPRLLRRGEIGAEAFLKYMDSHYCAHFADVVRSGHRQRFCRGYGRAVAALVMEGWWSGLYLAMGVGSLIEARPDYIANDRLH
ncbi:hypothetical protein CP532_2583 [Ophiocordyceps camponoti-leonardi (nom. inval.)]|nr:hypothetical protein CP532_2583 [Ophiocordyceps camponoti-leonardi (nom. inval.)]